MKKKRSLQKHTFWLFAGQFERLQALHPDGSATQIIRVLIDTYLDKASPPMSAEETHKLDQANVTEIL